MLPSSLRPLVALVIALASFGALGCAQERAPINKVQSNALAKSFFVGDPGSPSDDPEFYWRNFVVDASESQSLVGIGSWSGIDRIKWEITESKLIARRAYQQNPGADNKGTGSGFPNGTIVASYPILSHFDIKRAYNPQTGEELNVIEENTTDRPWYQRGSFRVDWSVNDVNTPLWTDMFVGKLTGEIKLTPVAYYVSDANHDDAPHFESEKGYFDVTSKFLVEAAGSEYPGFPQCALIGFYTGSAVQNCDAQEAVVRSSYLRVDQLDPDQDFEPFENTRASLDIVGNPGGLGDSLSTGIVTPPRISWDPGYGYVDAGLKRLMHVHDIWKQSHQTRGTCTTNGECASLTGRKGSECLPSGTCTIPCSYAGRRDGDGDGTDDGCRNGDTLYKGATGSQCSVKNRCTIPYRDRATKPVAWWVNTDMPDVLLDEVNSSGKRVKLGPTEDVVYTWNQAVTLGVAHAREVECRRTGGARAACHARYFDTKNPIEMVSYGGWGIERVKDRTDVVVTCHNPVRDYDPEVCGDRGATARVGDLRHHFIFYWPYSSQAPWGGIANWNADPLTGRIIGGGATVMGRSAASAAAQVRDILLVANGELSMSDITDGVPAALYQQQLRVGRQPAAMTATDLARRASAVDIAHAAQELGLNLTGTPDERLGARLALKVNTTADPGMLAASLAAFDGDAKPLIGSSYESQLMSPGWLVDSAGMDPSTPLTDATLARVSPLRGADPARLNLMSQLAMQRMNSHGVCVFAAGDGVGNPDVRGVARWFGAPDTGLYGDNALARTYPNLARSPQQLADKRAGLIYDHLFKETYKGIALHEVGHAMGMLHNFASSYDATNYDPQYWQLRTSEGGAADSCNGQPRQGIVDSCMGPRFLDPETDDELGQGDESRPGISYFGHTSTMEYQNERFFETIGLGQFDAMTMGALYGRVLETFDADAADGIAQPDQDPYKWLSYTQLTEDSIVSWRTAQGSGPQAMHYTELARRIKLFDPERCRAATADELRQAEWRVVHGKVCAPPPKDHATWEDFVDGQGPKQTVRPDVSATAAAGNVRWPYRWGVASNSYVHLNPFDSGADVYEVTRETIRKFDYSYPFVYFRRQRRDWDHSTLPSYTANHFFSRLRSYHWVTSGNNASLPGLSAAVLSELKGSDDVVRGNLLATTDMFDAIARALLAPQIGDFSSAAPAFQLGATGTLYDIAANGRGGGLFSLDASNARYVDPEYSNAPNAGGSWDYHNWINHAGFDVEKGIAALSLADGRPTLSSLRRDTFLDGRHLNVSFRTDMAKAVDRLVGGVLASDWDSVAPYVPNIASPPEGLALTDDVPARPKGAFLLFPNLGYRQQLETVIFAEIFSRESTDLTLANKLRVFVESTSGVIDIPDAEKIKFTDPRSGFTYVARLYGPDVIDGKTVDQGIGSRMVARANQLLTTAYQVELGSDKKPLLDRYGRPTLVLDPTGQPIPSTNATSNTGFTDYIGLLDATVQIARIVGHGPL
jgi:hypothetical protein